MTVRRVRLSKRFARAELDSIIEPSPDRVEPPCPHYVRDRCGGCQLQHLAPSAQLAAKQAMVGEALRRIGKLDVADPDIERADAAWGYRNKVTLAVSENGARIGYHRLGLAGDIFDLDRCPLAEPALMQLWAVVREYRTLLPDNAEQLVLRRDGSGGLHLTVRVRGQEVWQSAGLLHRALIRRGVAAVLWWKPEAGAPRAVAGAAEPYPADVFEQVHPAMGARVRTSVLQGLGNVVGLTAWDLYAGVGETSALLAAAGATVESVELDARAVREAARRGPEQGIRRYVGRAEDVAPRLKSPDLVVTNPPRTGMDARVVEAIAAAHPKRVAYVSCDAATLARDLARLLVAWGGPAAPRIVALRAFDLFPQTAHVETVAILEGAG